MADYGNTSASDEDSNEDIDHIPKTPGPAVISDREESDEEKSGDEDRDEEDVKNRANDSESDSDSSDSESQSSNDNNRNSQNDSEVERSDNENDNRLAIDADDGRSSDEDADKSDNEEKAVNESQDNDSEDEEVNRRRGSSKRKFDSKDDSSSDESHESKSERTEKKRKLEISDNEDNEDNEENEESDTKKAKAKDIFGEMSSEEEDEDNDRHKGDNDEDEDKHSDKDSSADENIENEHRLDENSNEQMANNEAVGESFIEEDEPQEEPVPETRIEVEIPRIVADLGNEVHFVKLPNFLSIDTHPYDPQWYEDEIDEDENLDDEGRARLKLKVENTIRWKNGYDKETGELKRESNARVVRWSDGSLSLHLGDEIFDIHKLQLMPGDNNHLFIRQGTGLQGQTVFRTKLTFRPFSTESFTHRKLTLSLADRSQKTQKIRVLPNVGKDPEAHRSEMIKKEEDRLKASIRRENKQRRVRERSLIRGPTASYLEPDGDEDDEEEGISISKIKNQFKRNNSYSKYADDADSGEESKHAIDDDDSDLDIFDKKAEGKKKAAHIVESDDDE